MLPMENSVSHTAPVAAMQPTRMEWLDAMRGFTMILVVMYHVAHISFGVVDKHSSCQPFFLLFRMPLFFFVSGFLAYKANMTWTRQMLGKMVWKKMKIQIVPTFVFLCISVMLLHKHYWDTFVGDLMSPTKGGYWFTWVLLHMFLIYYVVDYFGSRLKKLSWLPVTLLWLVALVLYALSYMPPVMKLLPDGLRAFLNYSSLIQTIHYMQFFLFGNIVHRYWKQCQHLADTSWFFVVVIVLAFVATGDALVWHNLKFMWRNIPLTIASYTLLMLVVMFFRYYQMWFTHDKPVGRALQYIGTRTLDIYLLHYLFLPSLPMVGIWLSQHRHNFVVDFSLSVGMALVVIAFCLVVSNILRISPFLSEYLFGRKKRCFSVVLLLVFLVFSQVIMWV